MINAHLDGEILVVKVSGTLPEFSQDLHALKTMFEPRDIHFDDLKKCWFVTNLDRYPDCRLLQVAMKAASLQLPLFKELSMKPKTKEAVEKVKSEMEEAGVSPANTMVNAAMVMQDILRASGESEAQVKAIMGASYRED